MGQDFGNEADYSEAVASGEAATGATWRNLLSLFERAGIPVDQCFFTNAIMGIRLTESNVGRSPAFGSASFIATCANFLRRQVEPINPTSIAVLAREAGEICEQAADAEAAAGVLQPRFGSSISAWDASTNFSVTTIVIAGRRLRVARFLHPCYRHANLRHRKSARHPTPAAVDEFELQLLRGLVE